MIARNRRNNPPNSYAVNEEVILLSAKKASTDALKRKVRLDENKGISATINNVLSVK